MPDRLSPPDAARRRFNFVHTVLMLAFAGSVLAAVWLGPRVEAPALRWLLVLVPSVLLAWSAWEFVTMVRRDDERMQLLALRAVSMSAGVVLVCGTIWGMLEVLVGVPGLPGFLLLPAFAVFYGLISSVLASRG